MGEAFAAGPTRPRRRLPAVVLVVLAAANVAVWGGSLLLFRPAAGPAGPAGWAEPPPAKQAVIASPLGAEHQTAAALPVFATGGGVALRLVAPEPVAVAFHEASFGDAVALQPTGVCGRCKNPTKFVPPSPADPSLRYLVMHSRGRDTPATSATDVVLPGGTPVLSPVDGVVVRVRLYRLYRSYPDVRLEIRPDGAVDRRVVLLHLGAVRLRRGDRLQASVSVVGTARRLPFESQVDRYVRGRYPHVHLEVKDAAATRQETT